MAAKLRILDGNPIWLSDAIVPSKDLVVSPSSPPHLATVNVSSADVFVYVKVENTGTVDLSTCSCTAVGAWGAPTIFANFLGNTTASQVSTVAGVTFNANSINDTLTGPGINVSFGASGTGRRGWAWSPDNRFFAYVGSASGPDWFLTIVALQNVIRSDGTTIAKGSTALTANGIFAGTNAASWWNNSAFGWAGSKGVIAAGTYAGGPGLVFTVACLLAPSPNSWGTLLPDFPGQVAWAFLVSPCAEVVAFAPKRLTSTAPPQDFFLVATATAKVIPFRKSNAVQSVSSSGPAPAITTISHTANGVRVNTGNGTLLDVDDPECTSYSGGVTVRVDRVKASTLPSANLGVKAVGTAVLGACPVGSSSWVQVPNQNGWANQSEPHWCLLAQTYTNDLVTVPRSWDGQATSPPPFPVANDACAQRNIEIT
jgi:hypothetical protein